jgi:hypothetical protein
MDFAGLVTIAVIVAAAVILAGILAQGRLKHLLLMMLGATPRRSPREMLENIPREERHWSVVDRVNVDDESLQRPRS